MNIKHKLIIVYVINKIITHMPPEYEFGRKKNNMPSDAFPECHPQPMNDICCGHGFG